MNKQDLISKIKQLDGVTQDERAYLINLVNTKKKYGLVWEDKPEDVEEQLRNNLPVLREVVEKRILAPSPLEKAGDEAPNHILIEGDNLHALTALTFTHEGKIDVIYIDPPYNTGNKDFKYNDTFVDKEDSYRHSKWLSFMDKRLRIAHRLLNESGVVFISIDDNEQAQLKLLCDEIFGIKNFVATIPTIMNLKGNHDNYGFADTHEYFLVYTKAFEGKEFGHFAIDETEIEKDWNEDEYGYWKKADTLRRTGQDASRAKRPKGWFPIFITNNNEIYITDDDKPINVIDNVLWPINDDGDELSWTWQKSKIKAEPYNLIVTDARNGGLNIYKKQRPQIGDLPTKKPKSFFYKAEYSTSTSTNHLKEILGSKKFEGPKPVPFLKDLFVIANFNNGIILDFFAGSGTTLHATMALNDEDGGNRQCILITNNENNICEEVTYERNKRVIEGYTSAKGIAVAGLENNNLRYFKSEYVSRTKSLKNKKELTRLATELLCIKENCYNEVTTQYGVKNWTAIFESPIKQLIVIYDDLMIEDSIEIIKKIKENQQTDTRIKVYVFSNGQYPYTEDFEDVAPFVELCALPDAIYKAYQNVLPKTKRDIVPTLEDDETTDENLFNQSNS
ncbi:site-specific DNA-methyltransferase [Flavobacterium sp.]|jgi:adenine-specific DNA-methyltransferase|uniref:site-specific DNA-methyltransferase n=1 Tax=Flavobacterium sp. TaxID=239 RepID=UPI0037C0D057